MIRREHSNRCCNESWFESRSRSATSQPPAESVRLFRSSVEAKRTLNSLPKADESSDCSVRSSESSPIRIIGHVLLTPSLIRLANRCPLVLGGRFLSRSRSSVSKHGKDRIRQELPPQSDKAPCVLTK